MELRVDPDTEVMSLLAADLACAAEPADGVRVVGLTDALVDELRSFSPLAQRTAKKLLNDTEDSNLTIAIELEGHSYSRLRQSDDFKEGMRSFAERRPPEYTGW